MQTNPPSDSSNRPRKIISYPSFCWPKKRVLKIIFGFFPKDISIETQAPGVGTTVGNFGRDLGLNIILGPWNT
jgi:hypothetical protein